MTETIKAWHEVERLRAQLAAAEAFHKVVVAERNYEPQLAAAEAFRLRADAERYRWLRGGPEVPPHSTRWPRWEVRYWDGRYWQTLFAEHLDAAIDAAMKEEGK